MPSPSGGKDIGEGCWGDGGVVWVVMSGGNGFTFAEAIGGVLGCCSGNGDGAGDGDGGSCDNRLLVTGGKEACAGAAAAKDDDDDGSPKSGGNGVMLEEELLMERGCLVISLGVCSSKSSSSVSKSFLATYAVVGLKGSEPMFSERIRFGS